MKRGRAKWKWGRKTAMGKKNCTGEENIGEREDNTLKREEKMRRERKQIKMGKKKKKTGKKIIEQGKKEWKRKENEKGKKNCTVFPHLMLTKYTKMIGHMLWVHFASIQEFRYST